jgi:flagellar hook-length control protein FliK
MNDLRLPGLNAPLGPAARTETGASPRGDADAGNFDAALLRSAQGANRPAPQPDLNAGRGPDRSPQRKPERPNDRIADAARAPRDAERAQRAPKAGSERAPAAASERATEGRNAAANPPADTRTAASAARDAAAAGDGSETAPARSASGEADVLTADADGTAMLAADSLLSAPTTAVPVASPAGLPSATATAAATEADAATGEPADAAGAQPARSAAAKASAPAASTLPAGKAVAAAPEAPTDAIRTPVKDRLVEDFERRYESALVRAAGIGGSAPLATANPLAAAGLPPGMAPMAPTTTVAYASVATPIGHPAFGQDLSHRILLFAGQHVQSAEIAVTPADLGPIRVAIEVRGQEAAMQFSAAHATTRAAIEDALPRLREMLAAQGLQLTQADVGDRSQRGTAFGERSAARDPSGQGDARGSRSNGLGALGATGTETANVRRIGLIDIRV